MSEPTHTRDEAGLAQKAQAAVAGARDTAGEVIDTTRGKAGDLQATLADKLEESASAVRDRSGVASETRARRSGKMAKAGEALAGRLDRTAGWLRENELADLKGLVQEEARARPGRTALIAVAIGFLLGRSFRR